MASGKTCVSVVNDPSSPCNQERLAQMQPNIASVVLRTLVGTCHSANRRAIDWGVNGLVAYGSHGVVVIVDPTSLQTVQCLDEHRASIVQVAWSKAPSKHHVADRMMLASADNAGRIIIWNVKSGEVKARLQEGSRPVAHMVWMDGKVDNTSHLLLSLHPPSTLVLWDTSSGSQVWKKVYPNDTLCGFDLDPFDTSRLVFRTTQCLLFIDDLSSTKVPCDTNSQHFYVSGPLLRHSSSSPSRTSLTGDSIIQDDKSGKATRTRIKKMMKEFVLGNEARSEEQAMAAMADCQQVLFHQCSRNHLILVYPREVLVLDLDIGQTVGMIALDRSCPIINVVSCHLRDALYLLYDNGSVSLRVRKRLYTVSNTPLEPHHRSLTTSVSCNNDTNDSTTSIVVDTNNVSSSSCMEIGYEQKALSDSVRFSKNARVLGMTVDPVGQKHVVVFTTDGKLFFVDLLDVNNQIEKKRRRRRPQFALDDILVVVNNMPMKLYTSGIVSGLATPPFVIRMCPPLTTKNWHDYVPLMAGGATNGNIQIYNMSVGKVDREFATHTFPVRGLEWTSLTSILSHAHQNLSGASGMVRNELMHTDIRTGRSSSLRSHRAEEPPIDMVRVSHLKQYFIVAFVAAPFELWDLRSLTLLRTMPQKFPPITALEWSPLHNLKSLKKKLLNEEKDGDQDKKQLVAKEHFVFTDPEGQLYHFSVEGNAIRDGTKVPAEGTLSTITCISWKSDHIVRGDSEGNLNVWDVRTKTSRNINTRRGMIKKVRFAPGRGNMKLLVLHLDTVAVWDVKECDLINELRSPKDMVSKPTDIEWAASDRPVIATSDGCLRIMSLALASSTSPMLDYECQTPITCPSLLPNKAKANLQYMLHHQPWNGHSYSLDLKLEKEGCFTSTNELDMVKEQLDLMDDQVKLYLSHPDLDTVSRCLMAAQICGLVWEADFWRLSSAFLKHDPNQNLDSRFDLVGDSATYLRCQLEKLHMHETKCVNVDQRRRVIDQMLCLGLKDEAVALLLESESDKNEHHYEDNLRACLVASCTAATNASMHSTTVKLVATNLIAEGKLWEGVQLLCLIDKVVDACTYLQSCGKWDSSMWLAKCRLANSTGHTEDMAKVAAKFADHCVAVGQRKKAVLVTLCMRDWVGVLDQLLAAKMIPMAAQFMQALSEHELMPDTSHAMVLAEEVSLAYARRLFDCGNTKGAYYYCDRADEKGEVLKRELGVLSSTNDSDEIVQNIGHEEEEQEE